MRATGRTLISDSALSEYRVDGFLYLRGVIPGDVLAEGRMIIEPWVDFHVDLWRSQGLIDRDFAEFDFWHRALEAWRAAGRPHFRRRPNRFLINPKMYAFLKQPLLLAIAERVLGTADLSVHGIFNARPQLPGATFTDTVWHQDSQYWGLDYGVVETDTDRRTHVMTMWIPLQPVDENCGALRIMSKKATGNQIFEPYDYDYKNTGYLGLSPEEIARYPHVCEPMTPGDALIFDQRTAHGTRPNLADHVRWSIDIRYEATASATGLGRVYGFVAQSRTDPESETSLEVWLEKCHTA